jgi:hypothetical protein
MPSYDSRPFPNGVGPRLGESGCGLILRLRLLCAVRGRHAGGQVAQTPRVLWRADCCQS